MAGEGGWDEAGAAGFGDRKLKNTLPLYGNKESMNINSMILTNILGSPYFKEELVNYKTFHEVVDEIYYKVDHLEPWEKNSRKLAGQVGMCAGVRGVAAGGIVSTAFCLLFKLFTLKLTRKQLTAMLNHRDSPYIRGIGFMYIRYCQPPADFWDWFSPYLDDEEEIDLKAGGGYTVTIGEVCRMMVSKLDWFGTLFPRLPVNVQKDLEAKMKEYKKQARLAESNGQENNAENSGGREEKDEWGEAARRAREERSLPVRDRSRPRNSSPRRHRSRSPRGRRRSRSSSRGRRRRSRSSSRGRRRKSRSTSRERRRRSRSLSKGRRSRKSRSNSRRRRSRSSSRKRRRSRSSSRGRRRKAGSSSRERHRRSRSKDRSRSRERRRARSRSRERSHESRERRRGRSRSRENKRGRPQSKDRASKNHRSRSRSKERRLKERKRSHSRDKKDSESSRNRRSHS